MLLSRGGDDAAVFADNYGARPARAYVDSENMCMHFWATQRDCYCISYEPAQAELGRGTLEC